MNSPLSPQHASQAGEFQKLVMHALGLRSELRKVFLLCEVRGCTVEEAAKILDISVAAAAFRLERARREIKVRLTSG